MFHNYSDILVIVNVNRKQNTSDDVHDAALAWTQNVTINGFQVFVRALDTDQMYVDWVAYQVNVHTRTKGSLIGGRVDVPSHVETACTKDINEQEFTTATSTGPFVVSVQDSVSTGDNWRSTMAVWVEQEASSKKQRRACVREATMSVANHTGWKANWLRAGDRSDYFDYTQSVMMDGGLHTPVEEGPHCQNITFGSNQDRVTIISRSRDYDLVNKNKPSFAALSPWIEADSGNKSMICFDYSDPNEVAANSGFDYLILDPNGNNLNYGTSP